MGSAAFNRGLEHIVDRSVRFDAHLSATLQEVVPAKRALHNVYAFEPENPIDPQKLEDALGDEPAIVAVRQPSASVRSHRLGRREGVAIEPTRCRSRQLVLMHSAMFSQSERPSGAFPDRGSTRGRSVQSVVNETPQLTQPYVDEWRLGHDRRVDICHVTGRQFVEELLIFVQLLRVLPC